MGAGTRVASQRQTYSRAGEQILHVRGIAWLDNKDEERREKFTAVRWICEEPLSIFFKFPLFLFPILTKISRIILVQNLLKLVADSFIVLQQQYHDKRLKGLAKVSNICWIIVEREYLSSKFVYRRARRFSECLKPFTRVCRFFPSFLRHLSLSLHQYHLFIYLFA